MYGWIIADRGMRDFAIPDYMKKYTNYLDQLIIIYNKFPKFQEEQILYHNEQATLVSEGVLLNSSELKKKHDENSLPELLINLCINNEISFLTDLRGPFCGFIHNRNKKNTILFTNRVGDRPVYYYNRHNYRIASSNLNMLIAFCHENGLPLSFNVTGGKIMLQYGFMVDGRTMVREITRLFPGSCLIWERNKQNEYRYHIFDDTEDHTIDLNQAVEEVDRLFRQAVKRGFDKNLENAYQNIADMSGGMDSRMTSWVARDLGYQSFLNINYGIPSCVDYQLASKISADLKNEFFFKSLSDASFIFDVDETVYKNFGSAIYVGPTGALRTFKYLDTINIGMRHTGTVGGPPFGSYLKGKTHYKSTSLGLAYSQFDLGDLDINYAQFSTEEIHKLYVRCFLGVAASHILLRDYVVTVSPFLDEDLLDFLLHVPVSYRVNYKLYAKWVREKYPEAAAYPWNSKIFRVYHNKKIAHVISGSYRKALEMAQKALYHCGLTKYRYRMAGMNPMDAIVERNLSAKKFMDDYYQEHIDLFSKIPEFQQLLKMIYGEGQVSEKTLVMGVMSFVKQHNLTVRLEEENVVREG